MTKKQIMSKAFQKAYRLAYKKGKAEGLKDSVIYMKIFVPRGDIFHTTSGLTIGNGTLENLDFYIIQPAKT